MGSNGFWGVDVHLHDRDALADQVAIFARNDGLRLRLYRDKSTMAAGWIQMGRFHVAVLRGIFLRQKRSTTDEPNVRCCKTPLHSSNGDNPRNTRNGPGPLAPLSNSLPSPSPWRRSSARAAGSIPGRGDTSNRTRAGIRSR